MHFYTTIIAYTKATITEIGKRKAMGYSTELTIIYTKASLRQIEQKGEVDYSILMDFAMRVILWIIKQMVLVYISTLRE
jgi:hypothetical protein